MTFAVADPQRIRQLRFEGNWPTSVAFLDDDRLAAGNRDGQIFVWDLSAEPVAGEGETKEPPSVWPVRQLLGHANGITRLRATADGRLVSASLDHTVRLWDPSAAATGRHEVVLDIRQRKEAARRQRDDGLLTAPGIEVETQEAEYVFEEHGDWVHGLGLDADGTRLISGDDAGLVVVRDLTARKEIARWQGHPMNGVVSTCLTADGGTACVTEYRHGRGSFDRPPAQARLYDATTGEERIDLLAVRFPEVKVRDNSYGYRSKWVKFVGRGFVCSAFGADGRLLALGMGGETSGAKVHVADASTGEVLRTVSGHRNGVCDVLFSADGSHLITSGRDTLVRVLETESGKEVAELGKSRGGQFKDWMHAVALSPSQRLLAAADIAGLVHVWRLSE